MLVRPAPLSMHCASRICYCLTLITPPGIHEPSGNDISFMQTHPVWCTPCEVAPEAADNSDNNIQEPFPAFTSEANGLFWKETIAFAEVAQWATLMGLSIGLVCKPSWPNQMFKPDGKQEGGDSETQLFNLANQPQISYYFIVTNANSVWTSLNRWALSGSLLKGHSALTFLFILWNSSDL